MKIKIYINDLEFKGELNDTDTAKKIYDILPLRKQGRFWGNEIYFPIPMAVKNENPTEVLEIGDLAYWPRGNGFCIFYGQTPASTDKRPRPANPVTKVGKMKGDLEQLKSINDAEVKIEKLKES